LQAMRELNLMVFNDYSSSGQEVEGKTFIGGNANSNANWGIGNGSQGGAVSSRPTLTVVGNANLGGQLNNGSNGGSGNVGTPAGVTVGGNLSNLNMNAQNATLKVGGSASNVNGSSGSTIQVGGATSGNFNLNGATLSANLGPSFTQPLVNSLTAERSALIAGFTALSSQLAAYEWEGNPNTITQGGQGAIFNVADSSNGYALFTINAADVGNQIAFNLVGPVQPIVINVLGTGTIDWNANAVTGTINPRDLNPWIIWNFVEATAINFNRQFHGSVLAVNAALNITQVLEGSVIGKSATQSAEIHLGTYAGGNILMEPIPEPASWAMMIAGFGLVGATMRRRRVIRSVVAAA
ncbi:collagen-binding domain-containing protein, partial [Polymorphobacter multimanifer]